MSTNSKYKVVLEDYAAKHFLFKKYSKKKLRSVFEKPKRSLFLIIEKVDLAIKTNIVDVITDKHADIVICKVEFKIYPKDSPKKSGNRCIVAQDKSRNEVRILFAYHKSDIKGAHETLWWKRIVKDQYPVYKDLL